jgi:hypothetical protein
LRPLRSQNFHRRPESRVGFPVVPGQPDPRCRERNSALQREFPVSEPVIFRRVAVVSVALPGLLFRRPQAQQAQLESTAINIFQSGMFDTETIDQPRAGGVEEVVIGLPDEGLQKFSAGCPERLAENPSRNGDRGGGQRSPHRQRGERGEPHASHCEGRLSDRTVAWAGHDRRASPREKV